MIFDLREPPVGHVYHKMYINQTLGSIAASGIQHDKVRVRRGETEREGGRERGRQEEVGGGGQMVGRILINTIWQRNCTARRGLFSLPALHPQNVFTSNQTGMHIAKLQTDMVTKKRLVIKEDCKLFCLLLSML